MRGHSSKGAQQRTHTTATPQWAPQQVSTFNEEVQRGFCRRRTKHWRPKRAKGRPPGQPPPTDSMTAPGRAWNYVPGLFAALLNIQDEQIGTAELRTFRNDDLE